MPAMVAGYQRLNERKSQPNPNIVFIKPLTGPDEKIARDFLERIAAQCRPIMREHYLYVTSLEEYEPNREFVGRNFNAGEVVQLVLKSPSTGRWLPFDYVQMVMMHELAHCKQMNHSRAFWAVRNSYAAKMTELWSNGYTGDGVWGRGTSLGTGEWENNTVLADEVLPEHLCGGTYRSRRKRKAKFAVSYQERKERRILKKFGKNGVALGADEDTKVKLEKGKKVQGKPRVAGSARGRELRAAAALARFGTQKDEESVLKEDAIETDSGSGSEYEDDGAIGPDSKDAVDVNGKRMLDGKGQGMVKVCEDEDGDDPSARNELDELQGMIRRIKRESLEPQVSTRAGDVMGNGRVKSEAHEDGDIEGPSRRVKPESADEPSGIDAPAGLTTNRKTTSNTSEGPRKHLSKTPATTEKSTRSTEGLQNISCSMCSFSNPRPAITCAMCANVLDHTSVTNSWQCQSDACRDTLYRNASDCGVCGLCGHRRQDAGSA
ncbi:WLM domain-containing protein [Dactylonectria macrodidyma]|uniref:WLM domain-containing protein n=1 Tax=Dactylonectria macrodidyma TaxID=307937 RepID=A0A9P9JLQ8_9HYPO|nr:WLM domain-containing protein [Dactylonectria macrodidyma]